MLGYSVTRDGDLHRLIRKGRSRVSFLSIEPLLGPVNLRLGLYYNWKPRWIIVGAETGNRKEKVRPAFTWIRDIRDYALMNAIPLFFKESLRPYWTADGYFPQEYPVHA
jgi:protein gp37